MTQPGRVLAVVSSAVFMASLDLFIVNIAFPDIARDFPDTSLAGLSWVLTGYAIVFAALLVPAGRFADRIGRKRCFLAGLALFVAASAACAAAPSVEFLVAFRVVQAVGAALLMPTSLALLLAETPADRRAAAIGVWAAMGGVAAAAGPPIGGLLVQASWRWVFLINLPVGLAAIYAGTRVLRESREPSTRAWPDIVGTVLLAASIAVLVLGLVKAPDWGWGSAATLGCLAAAAVGIAIFVWRCAHHPAPVIELGLLRVRSLALACTSGLLFFVAFGAMLLAAVLFMTGVWHDSVLRAGLQLAPGPFMAGTFAAITGRLVDRVGSRTLAAAGASLFALGCAWWAWQVTATPEYASAMLPGMLVTGIGVGLTMPSLGSAAVASLPPARLATGSAVFAMSRQLGSVLGVAVLIAILGHPDPADVVHRFHIAWVFMALASGAAAVVASAIGTVVSGATLPAAERATV
jgi:EmrB/QacA subfamily drug resistance transporter